MDKMITIYKARKYLINKAGWTLKEADTQISQWIENGVAFRQATHYYLMSEELSKAIFKN